MSRALYRKYRSKSLSEIVGQQHVTDILARSLAQGKIAHAYLLTGPRGTGKTSIGRILAHEINQLPYTDDSTHLDIIEIDAASNNGVEDVRDLREKVQLAPVSASKKVYIIDEVHMLSKAAFNALLKTLEEPPEHVVFILATTDVDKLPATILSRTQRFGLRAASVEDSVKNLRHIADQENIKIDDESLTIIAERGDGSFRDSVSLLDQLSSLADDKAGITPDLVEATLGLAPRESVTALLAAVKAHDTTQIVKLLDEFDKSGTQATLLTSQLIRTIRSTIAEHPQLISLLDSLLEVSKSSHPTIKLLTVLVNFATPKTKSAALAAPAPVISKSVEELKKTPAKSAESYSNDGFVKKTSVLPVEQRVTSGGAAPEIVLHPKDEQKISGADQTAGPASAEPKVKNSDVGERKGEEIVATGDFDWAKLLDYMRKNHVAIHSVLSKCTPELTDVGIKLYTGSPFYKKKLDDPKYLPVIHTAITNIGAGSIEIEIIGTPPPPKDSQAAAVAAIMGGGEEVSV